MTDPIADYLTRVRNALQARHKRVEVPASTLKREISRILVEQHYITGFSEVPDTKQGVLRLQLRYVDGRSTIEGLQRISKPGLRQYVACEDLPRVLNGLGIAIISTSKGLMTDRQAREQRVGGEVLCQIW